MKHSGSRMGLLLLFLFAIVMNVSAQGSVQLFVSEPDLSQFPTMQFNVRTAGFESVPLASLDGLSVRENGIPISNVQLTSVPVGVDVVFVLDSNDTAEFVDDGIDSRYEKMLQSVQRFGTRFMNTNGLDTVSVVVPSVEAENGRFIVNAATSIEQINAELEQHQPAFPPTAPLNDMMQLAIDQLNALQTSNHFQAILLMSDAGRLPELLNTTTLVEQAQAANIAIFVAIVGGGVSFDEIENAAELYQPTNGFYVPMPNPQDSDPIYLIWQRQSNQVRVSYESLQRENGRYPITLNIGQANASTEFELALQTPELSLQLESDVIRRVGTAVDTPLENLVPAVQPVTFDVTFPDNLPRDFDTITLLVDAQPATLVDEPVLVDDQLQLRWNVAEFEAGAYELSVEVTDVLGKTAVSNPRLISIITEWPAAPTATPGPTPSPTPTPTLTETVVARVNWIGWIGGGLFLIMGLVILPVWLRWRRNHPRETSQSDTVDTPLASIAPFPDVLTRQYTAVLEPVTANTNLLVLADDNVTIGRLAPNVTLHLPDRSIAPLHARIRWQNGRYWLYDEGSETGTYLNDERLGLRPLPISEGDEIRLGRLLYRFGKRPLGFGLSEEEE